MNPNRFTSIMIIISAQAGFALRVAGMDNVRILQGGFSEWKAKGGFEANRSNSKIRAWRLKKSFAIF